MKYLYLTIIVFMFSSICFAQTEYTTKSGFTYRVGDVLEIGRPLVIAGGPIFGASSHWKTIYKSNGKLCTNGNLANKKATISKIDAVNGVTVFYFRIYQTNFYVNIDEAISKGEIANEHSTPGNFKHDKYDKLKEIRELYDAGTLTKEEFEIEKKKILNSL